MEYGNTGIREYEKTEFAKSFRDLKVFSCAYQLALNIHKASLAFPKTEQYALADQLRRSSKSVCANIAEGYGRQRHSKAEFKRFLMLALGSCDETVMWIDFSHDLEYIDGEQYHAWQNECSSIIRMLHKLREAL